MKTTAPLNERIFTLTANDLDRPFEGGAQHFTRPRAVECWKSTIKVDPFPCYAHDAELVAEIAALVETRFPIPCLPNYYLLSHEETSRTNGHASHGLDYSDEARAEHDDRYPIETHIVLSGKRIPLHPAMTRYLIAHEYGHCVNYWIEWKRDILNSVVTDFDREYAALRGVDPNAGYGGQKWHANVGELIANDFRICVCGIEREFWPHPGFAHPDTMPQVQEFWERTRADYAVADYLPISVAPTGATEQA